jgi:hypothetical protein
LKFLFNLNPSYNDCHTRAGRSIQAAAEQVLYPDKITWVVVGDRKEIEPGLRALNIADVEIMDVDGNPVPEERLEALSK